MGSHRYIEMVKSDVFHVMSESYKLSSTRYAEGHKSPHWDVFGDDFQKIIDDRELWPSMRRNRIASGMGGTTQKSHDFDTLCQRRYDWLIAACGEQFVNSLLDSIVGQPFTTRYKGVDLNAHDLLLVFNAYRIKKNVQPDPERRVNIIDIGGGYGAFMRMLKIIFPNSNIVSLDLPETNVIQCYYLSNHFDLAGIKTSVDFYADKISLGKSNQFEFLILPGWDMRAIPDQWADLVINMRSFMEMHMSVVNRYFSEIHRVISTSGHFYCVNRYLKSTVGEDIMVKRYPFDGKWRFLVAEPLMAELGATGGQPWVAELLARREERIQAPSPQELMAEFPPFSFGDCFGDNKIHPKRLRHYLFSDNPHIRLGIFLQLVELLKRPIRKFTWGYSLLKSIKSRITNA